MNDDLILVDSHCHLDDHRFEDSSTEELLKRAGETGVKYAQTICCQRKEFPELHAKALKFKNLFCSFGVHPHHAGEEGVTAEEIAENASKEKVIGIGETGLDYYYENAPKNEQLKSFEMHLEVAQELDMPVIIHTRDAEEDTMKLLDKALVRKEKTRLLFHCFSSNEKIADFGLERGIYFSASGIITFKKSQVLRDIFSKVPLDKLLLETDAPYLAPEPYRGKRNEPAYTRQVAGKMAEISGISEAEIAQRTTDNFFRLFSKAKPL